MAQNAQKKGGAPGPKGVGAGMGALLLLGGGAMLANNALFNVDGGHRAIKYTRMGGVKQEIYAEGQYNGNRRSAPSF
jgi:prohibitin 2